MIEQVDLQVVKIGGDEDGEIGMEQFYEYCKTRRETFGADYAVFKHFTDKG